MPRRCTRADRSRTRACGRSSDGCRAAPAPRTCRSSWLADASTTATVRARGDGAVRQLDVLGGRAAEVVRRRVPAHELLHRVGDERGVGDELVALVGVPGQAHDQPLAIERVVVSLPANVNSKKKAAICSSSRKCSVPVSSTIGVVMIVLMRSSPRFLRRFLVSSSRYAFSSSDAAIAASGAALELDALRREVAEALRGQPVVVGQAEELGDDVHREQHGEVLDHVELVAVAEVVEEVHARRADAGLEVGDHAGREHAAHHLAVPRVPRRIHQDHQLLADLVLLERHAVGARRSAWRRRARSSSRRSG